MEKKTQTDFYSELDQAKAHSSCSCSTFILFLLFLAISLSYIVWFGISQLKSYVSTPKVEVSAIALERAEVKLQDFLHSKKTTISTPISITLSDQELTSLLVKNQVLAGNENFTLANPSAVILPDGIHLSAELTKPLNAKLTVIGKPAIQDGKFIFSLSDTKIGKINVPKFLNNGLEQLVNRLVTNRLNDSNIIYDNAIIGSHVITLTGRVK